MPEPPRPMPGRPGSPTDDDPAGKLWRLWRAGQCPALDSFLTQVGQLAPIQLASVLRVDAWERGHLGERVSAEAYLERFPQVRADAEAAVVLIDGEFLLRERLGDG